MPLQNAVSIANDQEQNAIQQKQDAHYPGYGFSLCRIASGNVFRDILVHLNYAINLVASTQTQGLVGRNDAAIVELLFKGAEMVTVRQLGGRLSGQRSDKAGVLAAVLTNLPRLAGIHGASAWRKYSDLDGARTLHRACNQTV